MEGVDNHPNFQCRHQFHFYFHIDYFAWLFCFSIEAKLIARCIIVVGQTDSYTALFSKYGKRMQAAGDCSFCRQICPVCILVGLNPGQMEIFGVFWPEMLHHEKIIYCFTACRFLDLLSHLDSHYAGSLLQKQRSCK